MTAPSKMTKAELRTELEREKAAIKRLQAEVEGISKSRQLFRERLLVREKNLKAEAQIADTLRKERDKYLKRYGEFRDRQIYVQINAQTHYPDDWEKAKEFVRTLIDLGIWYFTVGELRK